MKPPVLLCYNLTDEQGRKITLLAMRLMIRIRTVRPEEYGQPLAVLCGMEPPTDTPAPAEHFADAMLVLGHFPPELLNRFLYGFRQEHIPAVGLKAILTDSNMYWDSQTLHSQLAEEHAALTNGGRPAHEPPES
ncbi:MAG: DUF3783 domain-containing protein [Eubacteriales bacterium]|nr:DUF3783 domain-containing protein [Eubacteriales bacterium]